MNREEDIKDLAQYLKNGLSGMVTEPLIVKNMVEQVLIGERSQHQTH